MEYYSSTSHIRDLYFESDSSKKIDYVIAFNRTEIIKGDPYKKKCLRSFVLQVEEMGFETEFELSTEDWDLCFLKIHGPESILVHYAEVFDIDLCYKCDNVRPEDEGLLHLDFNFMHNPLSHSDPTHPIFKRAQESVSGAVPTTITTSERNLITHLALHITQFGDNKYRERGYERLIVLGIIKAAYPLHDGDYRWTFDGPLSDRQLLAQFWAKPNCWDKSQPLDLIEKYFGPESAFYFNFVGFYLQALSYASIIAILLFVFGLLFLGEELRVLHKVCNDKKMFCPLCHPNDQRSCGFLQFSDTCVAMAITVVLDNYGSLIYGVFLTFWGALFLENWKRHETIYRYRWNLQKLEIETTSRQDFEANATYWRLNPLSGELEPCEPPIARLCYYVVTVFTMLLVTIVLFIAIFGLVLYRGAAEVITRKNIEKKYRIFVKPLSNGSGAFISACFIMIVDRMYKVIALWLTNLENPRTQAEFDNSYIFKSYFIEFVNNYSLIFYIAFVKGKFYTYPGDPVLDRTLRGAFHRDVCGASGCLFDLGVQLVVVLLIKDVFMCFIQVANPWLKIKFRSKNLVSEHEDLPAWEKDYYLNEFNLYRIKDETMNMIIQYGFVKFFSVSFPFAPLLAFICNIAELRVDAYKMIRHYRRPIPRKIRGLGAYNTILHAVTWLGVVTNALLLVYNKDFVNRLIFMHYTNTNHTVEDYFSSRISEFNILDYKGLKPEVLQIAKTKLGLNNSKIFCYYNGQRYPPFHPHQYQTDLRKIGSDIGALVAIIIFEHVMLALTSLGALAISEMPDNLKEHVALEQRKLNEAKRNLILNKNTRRKSILKRA